MKNAKKKFQIHFGLLIVFFLKFKLNPVNIIVDLPEEKVETDENIFFASLENYIRDHIDEVNVDQIRDRSGLTKYAFYTKFVDHFGKKPKEYLSDIKEKILQERQNELFRKRNSLDEI